MSDHNRLTQHKEQLIHTLRSFFGGVMFHAGKDFLELCAIDTIRVLETKTPQKIRIQAHIADAHTTYTTSLSFSLSDRTFSHSRCTCPYQWTICKHGAALGIAFVENIDTLLTEEHFAVSTTISSHRTSTKTPTKQSITINSTSLFTDSQGHHTEQNLAQHRHIEQNPTLSHSQTHQQTYSQTRQPALKSLEKHLLYAVIHIGHSMRLEFFIQGKEMWNNWPLSPSSIIKHYSDFLSVSAIQFLKHIHNQSHFDTPSEIQELLELLHQSNIPLYVNERSHARRLKFVSAKSKLAGSLHMQQRLVDGIDTTECIFHIDETLHEADSTLSYFGDSILYIFRPLAGTIEAHSVTPRIRKLCARIAQQERQHAGFYITPSQRGIVLHDELIEINAIITEARKCLTFITTLKPHFTIQKSSMSQEVLSVHYDNRAHALEIQAHIDYGAIQVDVSKTVYRNSQDSDFIFSHAKHPSDRQYHTRIEGNTIYYASIDEEKEIALFTSLLTQPKYGFDKKFKNTRHGADAIAQFYATHWQHIKKLDYEIIYTKHIFDFIEANFTADVHVDMNEKNDWLSFDATLYCGDETISIDELQQYMQNQDACIRMKDGRMMKITNVQELEKFVTLLKRFRMKEDQSFEGALYHAPELDHFLHQSEYYTTTCNARYSKFLREAHKGRPIEAVRFKKKISATLREYQKDGIAWMKFLRKYGFAGILADDMGLGKTIQTLTLLDMEKQILPSMVICPKTLLFNWEQEAKTFFPHMKTLVIDGTPAERKRKILSIHQYDLIISSYPSIKKDFHVYDEHNIHFQYCLIDEAQFMKNHKTQNAKTVKRIHANYRLALTGTPLENNVAEIWSIFDFLMPGFLGTHAEFSKRYLIPIMKHSDARVLNELQKKVSCFMMRRTKENVLKELPTKIEQIENCELDDEQTLLYQEVLSKVRKNIFAAVEQRGFAKSQIHILAGLTKLRQICNHPALLLTEADRTSYSSSKLRMFEELIDEIVASDRKVLVFSQFTKMLDILQTTLKEKNIEHLYLSGKTKNRKELVEKFNSDANARVFLISLKAGGTGLNLTAADNVIIFDPWWNLAVENQAIDRAYRMGQKKSVNVYRLVTKGTIEEKILQLQKKKQFLFNTLVSESDDLFQAITWDDIKSLFDTDTP